MDLRGRKLLAVIGPGMLVAATGVGAGDLATAAFTGSKLGIALLWAVVAGAFLKFVINEGLARWQLATGTTLLEGCLEHLGAPFRYVFPLYLIVWSVLVGVALMSACGATMHAILPLFSAETDKFLYGIVHSAIAVILVRVGGYRLFERVMAASIGIMFLVVVSTAVALRPAWQQVLVGTFVPTIPQMESGGLAWTVALLGGVGGTLTVLCYGYWIREEGRTGAEALRLCRIDLACGYAMTALFGMSMLIIGSRVGNIAGGGASLLVNLADTLRTAFGQWGAVFRWAFLLGAWGAVFSSLLGVWQSLPYLFTDYLTLSRRDVPAGQVAAVDTASRAYRGYLYALASIPAVGLYLLPFRTAQKTYAIIGALVIPALAAILLYLNNQAGLVGRRYRNSWKTNLVLMVTFMFFLFAGWLAIGIW